MRALRSARLRSVPFQWALIERALAPDHAARLRATFPTQGFWLIDDHDGEKSYAYAARPLVTLGARAPVAAPDLDIAWRQLAEELVGDDYRAGLGELIGRSLDGAVMEASIWRWGAGHHLGPHRDMDEKIVTQVFYFADEWREEWGGTLQVLRSKDEHDLFFDVMPDNGSSSILVRSENSWHAVSRIAESAPAPRRSLIVTWFQPHATSPVWAVDRDGAVRCTVGVPETSSVPAPAPPPPVTAAVHSAGAVSVVTGHAAHPRRESRRGRRIGMVGTFDVENLGDLLFPPVAEHELRKRLGDIDLRLYSYRRKSAGLWPFDVESLGRLPQDIATLDGLLVGGGEIVHAIETIAPGYRPTDPDVHHPLGLWLTPTLLAAAGGIPIAWNAPGAVDGLPDAVTPLIESAMESVAYASVRDERSARILSSRAPRVPLRVVPDTVFGVGALIPSAPTQVFEQVREQLGIGDGGYIVVQPTAQLLPFRPQIVALVERAVAEGRTVVELPVGPIHGDAAGVLELPVVTATPDTWPHPLLIAELIARADGLIAQSLHAGIIAAVHGVPVFRPPVGADAKHGILESLSGVVLLDDPAHGTAPFGRSPRTAGDTHDAALSAHWDRVADALRSPATRTPTPQLLSLVAAMPHIAETRPAAPEPEVAPPAPPAPTPVSGRDIPFAMTVGARVHPAPVVSIIIPTLQRIDLLQTCLDTIDRHVAGKVAHETIVVANGTALDALHPIQHRDDVVLLRSRVNRGFAGACNWAAEHARGDYLVLLNDDVQLTPHCLEYLLATASREGVGAVGSKVVFPDGTLQEVGSVVWSDGSAQGIGRGLPADSRMYGAVRDVDFVSGCSLMVPRAVWNAVGGMDEGYFPAYYEDVDLCMRLRVAGLRVLVDPRAVVVHAESSSSLLDDRAFLHVRNRERLVSLWREDLADRVPSGAADLDLAVRQALHRAGGRRPRLLVVDDKLPDPSFGSGFGRMLVAVRELSAHWDITLLPTCGGESSVELRVAELGVDVARERAEDHLSRWAGWYDAVLVSRPHNFRDCADAVRRHQPSAALVYDAEALWHRRVQREAALAGDGARREQALREADELEQMERDAATRADHVICLSTDEAATLSTWKTSGDVTLIPPFDPATREVGGDFATRREVLFTGAWLAGPGSPNVDALRFFVEDVLPSVIRCVPDVRLVVTGGAPPPEVVALESPHVTVVGHVPSVATAFARARVAVVPTRVGSGVKMKTVEALQHGVPVVATTVGAEGVDYGDAECVAVHDDPEPFAAAVAALLTDAQCWQRAREAALRFAHAPEQRSGMWSAAMRQAMASHRGAAGVQE
jgi:GT2 family glycosyltransferase/glycosyltransferase involved in cell wall biosynthesis